MPQTGFRSAEKVEEQHQNSRKAEGELALL
jgi:hypothetical protein